LVIFGALAAMSFDPQLDPLRSDRGFRDLIAQMGVANSECGSLILIAF
jgi:hypothetical protein